MQLSALLVLLPLAAALPASSVDKREKFAACKSARDVCLNKCKPSFNVLLYPYCSASCNSRYLWVSRQSIPPIPLPHPTACLFSQTDTMSSARMMIQCLNLQPSYLLALSLHPYHTLTFRFPLTTEEPPLSRSKREISGKGLLLHTDVHSSPNNTHLSWLGR
jgi:hypothetical protein